MSRLTRRVCCISLLLVGSMAQLAMPAMANDAVTTPMPAEVRALGDAVSLRSAVRFRYWGFHAYDMQLWTLPSFEPMRHDAHAFALSITYARQIDLNDLVERSLLEMGRQAPVLPEQAQVWRQSLIKAFRDVRPGDRLTGVFRPPHQASFYFNGKLTANLNEAYLVPHFFGIWLSDKTSQPTLRQALLGLSAHDGVVNGW